MDSRWLVPEKWKCQSLSCVWLFATPWTIAQAIFQARILKWITISSSMGSSCPRDHSRVSCIASGFSTPWASLVLIRRLIIGTPASHIFTSVIINQKKVICPALLTPKFAFTKLFPENHRGVQILLSLRKTNSDSVLELILWLAFLLLLLYCYYTHT